MQTIVLCENCADPAACVERFRARAEALGLKTTLDGRLATIPGSIHLHLRPLAERPGTLEYTMDVVQRRSWLSWHENRHRPWIEGVVEALVRLGDV